MYAYCAYINFPIILVRQGPSTMPKSCQGTRAFMACDSERVWRSLGAGWGRSSHDSQFTVIDCCVVKYYETSALTLCLHTVPTSGSESHQPWQGTGPGSACLSSFSKWFSKKRHNTAKRLEKGHQGWQIMVFKSKQNPWAKEMHFLLKKFCVHLHSHAIKEVTELCCARWWHLAWSMGNVDPWPPPPSCSQQNGQSHSQKRCSNNHPTLAARHSLALDKVIILSGQMN